MSERVTVADRLRDGDTVYAALATAHEGLSEAESHALNARLVLMLAAEIGDPDRLIRLFETARSYAR